MSLATVSYRAEILLNPSQDVLRSLALKHTPAISETACGNLNKVSRNKARMAKYTYVIAPEADAALYSAAVIDRSRAQVLIDAQARYIEAVGQLIGIHGALGVGPRAVGVEWLYTLEGANIAGMQQVLSFPPERVLNNGDSFEPRLRVVYTPGLQAADMPGGQAILVDLENYTTYVIGPDYFGESKKGALRMLNELVYREGGLVLHAGAKTVEFAGTHLSMTIMGLSGTGKTTTTFSKQGEVTRPIQDDMVAIWPGGELSCTENGCFAKTHGLTEASEPVIYRGTVSPQAWLENVFTEADGGLDMEKGEMSPEDALRLKETLLLTGAPRENLEQWISGEATAADVHDEKGVLLDGWEFVKWTENGRSVIPLSSVEDAADLDDLPLVRSMGILNRDEGADAATPGIIRFARPEQAAGYFMLGETTKTSAAGKEVGKTRSPFTQPFFPLAHGLQAKRFREIAATMPGVDLWMMNTGYVGGDVASVTNDVGHKVKIRHSSAMLEALVTDRIAWTVDPDFGYQVVDVEHPDNAWLLERVPVEILSPVHFFRRTNQMDVYARWVKDMKVGRRAFLEQYRVDADIIEAVCGAEEPVNLNRPSSRAAL